MRRTISCIALTFLLVDTLACALNLGLLRAQVPAQTPTVSIVNPLSPTNSSFFEFNSGPGLINSTFTAAVCISTVTNLYSWQVELTWNSSIINYVTAWVPTDNVFKPATDNGATLIFNKANDIGPGILNVGCLAQYLSEPYPLDVGLVNVSAEGVLCDVNFTIVSIPNATQALSTNLGIQLSNPYVQGYLDSFIYIYPSTTETAVFAEPATVTIVSPQVTSSTVYINSDGSVSPSGAPISSVDNVTYTFTGNMSYPAYNGIVVERNNTVIDGNGYIVQGGGSTYGIDMADVSNVTIENANVEDFQNGIWLGYSSNITVSRNNATANDQGICLEGSSNDNVSENDATANNAYGIYVDSSSNNTVGGNDVTANICGIYLVSSSSNTVNGNNAIGNNYYGIYLSSSSSNNVVSGNAASDNKAQLFSAGILLLSSSCNSVNGNTATADDYGIVLFSSSNNIISWNIVTANYAYCIYLDDSSNNNTVSQNTATYQGICLDYSLNNNVISNNVTPPANSAFMGIDSETSGWGIELGAFSMYNTVSGNNVTSKYGPGVLLDYCSNNTVSGNNVANSYIGICLDAANNNNVSGNNATANLLGIVLSTSSNNMIHHNNFVGNTIQASVDSTSVGNVWDSGYPSGGNYWSDYNGTDAHSGPYQNVTGSDGIGDTPYIIDANNTDNYPLMHPWVAIPGDVNQDSRVDMADVTLVVNAFGSYLGHPRWNTACDLNGDGKVDLADLVIVLMNFGKHRQY